MASGLARSTLRYRPVPRDDSGVITFIQAHMATNPRHGFELLDKRAGKELYLDGSWAELFQEQLQAWQRTVPTQDEVEDTLQRYAELAQIPTTVH